MLTLFAVEVDSWDGLTMHGTVQAADFWQAARNAQKLLGGRITAVRAAETGETVAYNLSRLNTKERQNTHGKWDIFATISR